ncbi:hypothetical protein [Amycolatopsis jejuensis]|nr:hypothetical protein [Amycolatopsis jejuensis]
MGSLGLRGFGAGGAWIGWLRGEGLRAEAAGEGGVRLVARRRPG